MTEGYAAKIRTFLKKSADDQPDKGSETEEPAGLTAGGENMLAEKTEHFLKQVLSEVTKLPVGKIDAKAPMEDYGIDSIMIMHLTKPAGKELRLIIKNIVFRVPEYRIAGAVFYESTPGHAAGSDRDENRRNPCSQTCAV